MDENQRIRDLEREVAYLRRDVYNSGRVAELTDVEEAKKIIRVLERRADRFREMLEMIRFRLPDELRHNITRMIAEEYEDGSVS